MPSPRQDSLLPGVLLGLVSLVSAGCSSSDSIYLIVEVIGIPQHAAALRLSASLGGLSGPQNMELKPAPGKFVLQLPNDSAHHGEVLLDITALGAAGCVAGTVQNRVTVSGSEMTVMTTASLSKNALWPCPSPTGFTQRAIWGSAPDDVFSVGDAGTILHFDGTNWTASASPVIGKNLRGVGGSSRTRVFAGGEGGIVIRFDGSTWKATPNQNLPTTINVNGIGSVPPGRLFLSSVDQAQKGHAYASDDDGATWSDADPTSGGSLAAYNWGWVFTKDDGWVVGDGGLARHVVNGTAMSSENIDSNNNYAVWGSSANDVWVAGAQGRIAHRVLTNFVTVTPPPAGTVTLRSMSGNDSNNILLVGDMGTVLRYDGTSWQTLPSGTTKNLNAVFMNADGTAWITGQGNQTAGSTILLYYDPS